MLAACGADGSNDSTVSDSTVSDATRPTVVATTNILGDVARASLGEAVHVEVIMPLGADPHDFAPSARQAEAMEDADLLVVNGAGFEAGMSDILANVEASGTAVFTAADHVSLLTLGDDEHEEQEHEQELDEHDDEQDHDDEHDDEQDHEHDGASDPHLWTDPDRIAQVVHALGDTLRTDDRIDSEQLNVSVDAYLDQLNTLTTEMETTLAAVPADRRVLVTNHEVFGYFADRFDFEVIGTVIPSLSTQAEPSAASLERLAALIEAEDVPAVFAETTTSSRLADVLADEVERGDGTPVAVVELFSESLGEPDSDASTYLDMMATNASRIADALGAE